MACVVSASGGPPAETRGPWGLRSLTTLRRAEGPCGRARPRAPWSGRAARAPSCRRLGAAAALVVASTWRCGRQSDSRCWLSGGIRSVPFNAASEVER